MPVLEGEWKRQRSIPTIAAPIVDRGLCSFRPSPSTKSITGWFMAIVDRHRIGDDDKMGLLVHEYIYLAFDLEFDPNPIQTRACASAPKFQPILTYILMTLHIFYGFRFRSTIIAVLDSVDIKPNKPSIFISSRFKMNIRPAEVISTKCECRSRRTHKP